MKEVVVYSKNMCGYCTQAKSWLKTKGIEYKEINIEEQPEAREFVISEGPEPAQIHIDGKSVGGYTELVKLDESLRLISINTFVMETQEILDNLCCSQEHQPA